MASAETLPDTNGIPDVLEKELGAEPRKKGGWFTKLVMYYLRRYAAQGARIVPPEGTETERARRVIRKACIKSAFTGAAAGTLTTSATLLTAETEGVAGLITVPVAAAGVAGEMLYRSFIHVEMTCQLAFIFNIKVDPDDPSNLWRIYALAFDKDTASGDEESEGGEGDGGKDPGRDLVEKILHTEGDEVGHAIGSELVGETVVRNIVPVLGIASSSISNYRLTRKLGDTIRRYMRYQRALHDAFTTQIDACRTHTDLLIEGIWFVFTADGRLRAEEAATLAWMLEKVSPEERREITARFVEDEIEWVERVETVAPALRPAFFHALEVAAAVDKSVSLPERKLLRRVAKHLGLVFDPARVDRMIKEFEDVGVLNLSADDVTVMT